MIQEQVGGKMMLFSSCFVRVNSIWKRDVLFHWADMTEIRVIQSQVQRGSLKPVAFQVDYHRFSLNFYPKYQPGL